MTHPGFERIDTDVLVIGSGGSGLRAAIEAHNRSASVLIVAKEAFADAHTALAMGGVNVAIKAPATPDQHYRDTIAGGWDINNHRLARVMSDEMPARIADLEAYGVSFDRLPDGSYFTWPSGKQSAPLNLCAGDFTGREMMRGLLAEVARLRIPSLEHQHAVRVLKQGVRVCGALLMGVRTPGYTVVSAKVTIVATGGGGAMYAVNTNAPSNTGEGYAWGLQTGAELVDMEMIQFHPTGMAFPPEMRGTLVTEKVRGNGGTLHNRKGERFMQRYQPERMELAGRDEVARAIYTEIQQGRGTDHGGVYLDVTHWDEGMAESLVPDVFAAHMDVGIDIRSEMMEITPTMHHMMGGFAINEWGETTVPGLLAVGEVTASIHGANRLGGNSLAEGQVFGRRAGVRAAQMSASAGPVPVDDATALAEIERTEGPLQRTTGIHPQIIRDAVRSTMWDDVGIVRTREGLQAAADALGRLSAQAAHVAVGERAELPACLEVRDMLLTATAVTRCALERTESRGAHFRADHPAMDPAWRRNIRVRMAADGTLVTRMVDVIAEDGELTGVRRRTPAEVPAAQQGRRDG